MDDPKHTAKWIGEQIHFLINLPEAREAHGRIALILYVLNRFEDSIGTLYRDDAYTSGKLLRTRNFLLRAVGAEHGKENFREDLQLAYEEIAVVERQNFRLN